MQNNDGDLWPTGSDFERDLFYHVGAHHHELAYQL
jgi:hypothetical protein